MERIILSIAIAITFFGALDFIIFAVRSAPKSAVLGVWFWLLAFAGLAFIAYKFLPV